MIPKSKDKTGKTMMTLLNGAAKDDGCYYYVKKRNCIYTHCR